ncbi:TetR/AcrR family transcriptional regulator C-terminal domain-containing protein [Sinomonas sp. ASV486]|uniref:TetR/AcrR family transcriptional regulator C-terminal domain-containing protein n=1 Tax=Sinomonas sp. ASV486 TaxID=3051170 RepID=UPI0027DB54CE|nr:TetR/AcrR family transcriptional regulator C-terminal domain-containing protein [Sinomonas sp. ASV486]MDQ4489257.1 TetR/AcrR family transcriptional regulator C-terminal domain-containing protein [Sinomonas sp. ASV486]
MRTVETEPRTEQSSDTNGARVRRLFPTKRRGARTRNRIIDAAAALFAARPSDKVTVSEIAAAAGVFPNQITYHFGSKDSLFIHSAFALLLRDAGRIEGVGMRLSTAEAFRRAVARTVLVTPSLPVVISALALARAKPALGPVVKGHLSLLFRMSERHLENVLGLRGWLIDRSSRQEVKTFWAAAFGAILIAESGYPGTHADLDLAGTLTIRERG